MSIGCSHGAFIESETVAPHGQCPDCRMARIEALLQRIADALAPTPAQRAKQLEDIEWRRSERHLRELGRRM